MNNPTGAENARVQDDDRKARNLSSYYYSFSPTGCDAIDAVLESVASAGKRFHHTEEWNDNYEGSDSCVDEIQQTAHKAATALREAEQRGMMRAAVRYCHAKGDTFSEMQDNAHANPLYERGDMILVWVNEGDIIEHGHAIERAATQKGD